MKIQNCSLTDNMAAKDKEDAARYRWLRSRKKDDCTTPRIEVNQWTCNANDEGVFDSVNEGEVLAGDELDAAIDAMISNAELRGRPLADGPA